MRRIKAIGIYRGPHGSPDAYLLRCSCGTQVAADVRLFEVQCPVCKVTDRTAMIDSDIDESGRTLPTVTYAPREVVCAL